MRSVDAVKYFVSIVFWLLFVVTAPIGVLICATLTALSLPFDPDRNIVHAFISRWTHAYLKWNPGWDVKVLHRERLPSGPCVLVANHQSMADIPALFGLYHPFKFVSKASLFSLPLVGWAMRMCKYVRVERGKPRSMQQMMESCTAWLKRGMPVLIFPEGTYSLDGKLLPFRRGAFLLAIEQRVPIVPIIVEGTPSLVVDDGPWVNASCRIRITVQPPIPVDALGDSEDALAARVREIFESGLGQGAASTR